jgi:hypothetical protein
VDSERCVPHLLPVRRRRRLQLPGRNVGRGGLHEEHGPPVPRRHARCGELRAVAGVCEGGQRRLQLRGRVDCRQQLARVHMRPLLLLLLMI